MDKYEIVRRIEAFAPLETQEKWDCSGWIVDTPIRHSMPLPPQGRQNPKVLFALTITDDVVRQAREQNCDMIISHHPLFYVPLEYKDINIYCAHTNLDLAKGGTTDRLIEKLGFGVPLTPTPSPARGEGNSMQSSDLSTCVTPQPQRAREGNTEADLESENKSGVTLLSADHLSTCVAPQPQRAREGNTEANLESENKSGVTLLSADHLSTCVAPQPQRAREGNTEADLESQNNLVTPSLSTYPIHLPLDGFVRIVELETPITVEELRDRLLKISPNLRYVNNYGAKTVKTIGFCAGSGSEFIGETDAFVTGDLKFHTALNAKKVVFDIGHFESEIFAPELLREISGVEDGVIADEKSPFI